MHKPVLRPSRLYLAGDGDYEPISPTGGSPGEPWLVIAVVVAFVAYVSWRAFA